MRILVTDPLASEGLDLLRKQGYEVNYRPDISPDELLRIIGEYDAVVVRSRTKVTEQVTEAGKNLKVIARAGTGVDNIDVDVATDRGIPVVYTPLAPVKAVAELAIGHMISLARHLTRADAGMKAGKWEKKALMGVELYGKTLGFIGSGRIGGEVAKRAHAFGMRTIAYDPYLPRERAKEMGVELVDFDTVLKEADFLTIHALLTDETRGMIDAKALAKMKPTAYIINCARGPIIDEAALYDALKAGRIAGAALDVFTEEPPTGSPLLELENVVLTPHLGASTEEAQVRAATDAAEGVIAMLSGKRPEYIVNPEIISA